MAGGEPFFLQALEDSTRSDLPAMTLLPVRASLPRGSAARSARRQVALLPRRGDALVGWPNMG